MTAKLSIVVSDEMMNRIDDYRFGNRIDKKQTAVIDILEIGLRVIEGKAQTIEEDEQKISEGNEEEILLEEDAQPSENTTA